MRTIAQQDQSQQLVKKSGQSRPFVEIYPLSRRRLALVILAVAIPSLALIGLGVGLILQESQLEKTRRTEADEDTFQSLAASLERIASKQRDEVARRTVENGWSSEELERSVPIILVARVVAGELLLPWQLSGQAELFDRRIHAGQFGRALLRAERLEFTNRSASQAVRAYRTAAALARDTLQQAYAQLSLARSLEKSELSEEADAVRHDLLMLPSHFVDDFGVPLSLYAAQKLAPKSRYRDALVELLLSYGKMPLHLSPQAGYLYRAIHDTLRVVSDSPPDRVKDETVDAAMEQRLDEIGSYAQATLSSIRLQEDFRSVFPRLVSQTGEHGFTLYANDRWLLSISSDTSSPAASGTDEILVVLDAATVVREAVDSLHLAHAGYNVTVLSSESSPPNRWLGPPFQGIYAHLAKTGTFRDERGVMSRVSFIILAMVLVIGLTTLGFFLWWRDTQRELVTAKLRSDFVSSVSHELKTPLTSIRMFAETLRFRSPPNELHDDYLDTIIHESGRLTRLLNNVLDFSQIDKGTKHYHLKPMVIQQVVFAALEAMENPFRAQHFQVQTEIDESEIRVHADRDALEQVLLNLLTNAMKFSGDRRELLVGVRKNGDHAEVWVTDWGIGIHPDDLNQIFSSYYRGENAVKTNAPGTGLGLSLVHHAIEAHHGQIDVTSELGHGSTFTISLPLL